MVGSVDLKHYVLQDTRSSKFSWVEILKNSTIILMLFSNNRQVSTALPLPLLNYLKTACIKNSFCVHTVDLDFYTYSFKHDPWCLFYIFQTLTSLLVGDTSSLFHTI